MNPFRFLQAFAVAGALLLMGGCHSGVANPVKHGGANPPGSPPASGGSGGEAPSQPAGLTALLDGPGARTNAARLEVHVHGSGVVAYRFKSGPAARVDCQDAAGYGPSTPISHPLVLDESALPDGAYKLCVIGADGSGTWQTLTLATTLSWTLDRQGPGPFTLMPPVAGSGGSGITLSWTAAGPKPAQAYQVSLGGPGGCGAAQLVATVPGTSMVLGPVPGGHYTACVTAVDDLGNGTAAGNSGQIAVNVPAALTAALFFGDRPQEKTLVVGQGVSDGTPWRFQAVPAPAGAYIGRAAMVLDGHGLPALAYQRLDQPDLSPPRSTFGLATAAGSPIAFTHASLATAPAPDGTGAQVAIGLAPQGVLHVASIATTGPSTYIAYVRQGNGATSGNLAPATATAGAFSDLSLAVDGDGRAVIVAAQGGSVATATLGAGDHPLWTAFSALSGPACREATQVVAGTGGGAWYAAFLCTTPDGDGCDLAVASAKTAGSGIGDWRVVAAESVDPHSACPPVGAARPALTVDRSGNGHLFWRYRDGNHPGAWDLAYAAIAGSAGAPQTFGLWGQDIGFPQLALDGADGVYAAYLAGGHLQLAGDGSATLGAAHPVAVSGVDGAPLELVDFQIRGGHDRGWQGFTP